MKYIKLLYPVLLVFMLPGKFMAQPWIDLVPYVTGLNKPVTITNAGDNRLFVAEQGGKIRIVNEEGLLKATPFMDISENVTKGSEQGLLGLAFHPDYVSNGFFYINYTNKDGTTVVSRFSVSTQNPDSADTSSEVPLLSIDQPYVNHNAGDIKFGPDGYLYITSGDGGSSGDPLNNSQDSLSLLGKILRIDVNGGTTYTIPESNPFRNTGTALDEIWALGLRNPWRISFDRITGDLWIGDVGQGAWEEINYQPASSTGGENYGWKCFEGNNAYNQENCTGTGSYIFPLHEYSHIATGGCSVTGGFVYRGTSFPWMYGYYFFADYCIDRLWSLHDSAGTWILSDHGQFNGNSFSTFGEDSNGELYITGLSKGTIFKITDTASIIFDTTYTVSDTVYTIIDTNVTKEVISFILTDTNCMYADTSYTVTNSVYMVTESSYAREDTTYFIVDTTFTIVDTILNLIESTCIITDTTFNFTENTNEMVEKTYTIVDTTFTIGNITFTRGDTNLMIVDTIFIIRDTTYFVSVTEYIVTDTSFTILDTSYSTVDTSYTISVTSSTGIIFNKGQLSGINIYPNPALDYLDIEFENHSDLRKPFTIRDIQGKLIISGTLNNKRTLINIETLNPGIYLLGIDIPGKREYIRFIKE